MALKSPVNLEHCFHNLFLRFEQKQTDLHNLTRHHCLTENPLVSFNSASKHWHSVYKNMRWAAIATVYLYQWEVPGWQLPSYPQLWPGRSSHYSFTHHFWATPKSLLSNKKRNYDFCLSTVEYELTLSWRYKSILQNPWFGKIRPQLTEKS